MKPLPDFNTWTPMWQRNGWNNCFVHAADALDYLAHNDRPTGGESRFNLIDLEYAAYDIRRTIEAMNRDKG